MKMIQSIVAISALTCASGVAFADIADFYSADSVGRIYRVDGSTLEASLIIALENGFGMNEILYLDDGGILANTFGGLVRFDLATGEERLIFNSREEFGAGFHTTMGLASTVDGNVFFTTVSTTQESLEWYGGEYNPFTNEFTRQNDIANPVGLYFDHHQIGENLYLGADWSGGQISIIDTESGETTFIDTDFDPVSFFESNGTVYSMSKGGEIFSLDIETGSSEYYGLITGQLNGGGWIGAASVSNPFALPTPGTLPLLGLASIVATRRRR